MKPVKESVALVITDDQGKFLVVQRPDDPDDSLANVWGFPAVSLREGESQEQAAARVGQQKLGVEIALGNKIGDGAQDRGTYTLHLTEYGAQIVKGEPRTPQSDTSVTQYADYKYSDDPVVLIPAAQKGSQCSQLFLESRGIGWEAND